MPPTDASAEADAGTAPVTELRTAVVTALGTEAQPGSNLGASSDSEDTLNLRLPDEFIALFAEEARAHGATGGHRQTTAEKACINPVGDDLLDRVGHWGPTSTPAGAFHLVPVRLESDLPLITRWMNDPAVTAFWELAGAESVTEEHLRRQLEGDGRSVPCLGLLEGTPMSYWEIYRADLDLLARHYPARPHDTGIHLLVGGVANRGRGLGSTLLRAVADLVLDKRPSCARVVAEPDLRNTPSVSAFLSAGFRFSAEVDLPDKRAALMVRDRALHDLL
ncbi:GNAT family N-acetyltransferase [Streptomyces sp. NPDC050535]|uniref:GNAT family N-acetyltransferase n=1 Tax=Streptomyces sp. NPDC050535 TaxID=3365626 RepID=UPI0037ACC33E